MRSKDVRIGERYVACHCGKTTTNPVMLYDGLWWLELNGAKVHSGDSLVPNRANARKIIVAWRARHGQS